MFSFKLVKALLSLAQNLMRPNRQTVLVGNVLQNVENFSRINKNQQTTPNGLTKGFRRISKGQKVLETPGTAEIICRK
jgi:hypothetical protein